MRYSWKLGEISGIGILVHGSFLILPAWIALGGALGAAAHADSLSNVFQEAADKVLPSVVMIRNIPIFAARSHSRDPFPDKGLQGTPLGDPDRSPEFRRFFQNMTFGDLHRMPDMRKFFEDPDL